MKLLVIIPKLKNAMHILQVRATNSGESARACLVKLRDCMAYYCTLSTAKLCVSLENKLSCNCLINLLC